jgi:two-component system, chemotaxis family, protein-glutamate methylesterase/glutaminase
VSQVINRERMPRNVIVIGASAGGVTALRELFAKLPGDLDAAIAVVLHRSPLVESALAPVLGWRAELPVLEAIDAMPFERGTVYLAPRDRHLRIDDKTLRLSRGPKEHHTRPAIDPLFTSAASSCGARSVGVLLSGTGDDGVSGLISITVAGGISLVQDPREAAYPHMPRSAIINDHVQAALPVGAIADVLTQLARGESAMIAATTSS